jgi:hypothetical protein
LPSFDTFATKIAAPFTVILPVDLFLSRPLLRLQM